MRYASLALALGLTALSAGCGGNSTPPAATTPAPVAAVAPRPPAPKEPEAGPPLPPTTYEIKQRRDPFAPIVVAQGGTKGLAVANVKLAGIVEGGGGRSLGLVEAPDGVGYILKVGDVLGDGRVTQITRDSISFSVPGRPGQPPSTVTLKVRTD